LGLSQIKEIKMEKRELRLPKKIVANHLVASCYDRHPLLQAKAQQWLEDAAG
jgi:hypothetical protein